MKNGCSVIFHADVSVGCTFIPEVDLLLKFLLEVTNVIVFKFDHYQLRRKLGQVLHSNV